MDLYQHDSAMEAQALLPQQCHLQFHFAIHQGDVQQASICNSLGKKFSIRIHALSASGTHLNVKLRLAITIGKVFSHFRNHSVWEAGPVFESIADA